MTDSLGDQITEHARTAEQAITQLCRDTIAIPNMTPTDASTTIANLAAVAAGLSHACAQLSRILAQANETQALTMDSFVGEADADLAIGQARIHLDQARELAVDLYKLLDAAHRVTAHIVSDGQR